MTTPLYVLNNDRNYAMPNAVKVHSVKDVERAYADRKHSIWFAPHRAGLNVLIKTVRVGKPRHSLLALEKISEARRVLLDSLFAVVIEPSGCKLLPKEELREVLTADNREDLVVAARAVPEDNALVLFRGDLRTLIVPLSTFKKTKQGPKPDPNDISVTDYGQTIRMGEFEVAVEALLYEFDPGARRRLKARELRKDNSLGASIRRLRLQKGLSRDDFPTVTAKTIARIERGETQPHENTLKKIAATLDVRTDQLAAF